MSRGIFSSIYQRNEWNGVETRSGPGSGTAATWRIRAQLAELVAYLGAETVVDAACGEGLWQPELPGYLGLDVAPEAIEQAQHNHPDREYRVHDVVRNGCPRADVVLCRDVLQHLSQPDGLGMLAAIRASGSTWLVASTYVGGENLRIRTGGFYCPDLEAPPFGMPPAELLLHDGYDYDTGERLRDRRKMLGLWRLAP